MQDLNFKRPIKTIASTVGEIIEDEKAKNKIPKKKKKIEKIAHFISNGYIGEMILPKKAKACFAIYHPKNKHLSYLDEVELEGRIYKPATGDSLVIGNNLKIPSSIKKYPSLGKLKENLRNFVSKYVYIADDLDREIIITYIMLTWVFDRFSSIPYLRILGEFGTGKSRLLKVLTVCYNSYYTFGLASPAPIFRLIDKYNCTLIIDELEVSSKNEKNDAIKEIIRAGNSYDGVVARCNPNTLDPIGFKVFSPKILGSRRPTNDDALESRLISIRMQESKSENIPLQLDREEFDKDCDEIRSMLLYYRLTNYFSINPKAYKDLIDNTVSNRLSEMIAPLVCIRTSDKDFIDALLELTKDKNGQLREDKSMSFEAEILGAIYMIHAKEGNDPLVMDIVDYISSETKRNYSPRFLGNIMRDNFKLRTAHTRDGNVVIYEEKKILNLLKEYNISEIVDSKDMTFYDHIKSGIKRESRKIRKNW